MEPMIRKKEKKICMSCRVVYSTMDKKLVVIL